MTIKRRDPYIYVTWITGLLSGEKSCVWAAWFKAHFKDYVKAERDTDLSQWTADHAAMVRERAKYFEDAGFKITVEDQNDLKMKGKSGAVVSGKADLMIWENGAPTVIEDEKTGRPKDEHYWQMVLYILMWRKMTMTAALPEGQTIPSAVLNYKASKPIRVAAEDLTPERNDKIFALLREVGGDNPPKRRPSFKECRYCELTAADCPERFVETVRPEAPAVEGF